MCEVTFHLSVYHVRMEVFTASDVKVTSLWCGELQTFWLESASVA